MFKKTLSLSDYLMMNVLVISLQLVNKICKWDEMNMLFANIGEMSKSARGFVIKTDYPLFNAKMSHPMNAKEFVDELIKNIYNTNWNLPQENLH